MTNPHVETVKHTSIVFTEAKSKFEIKNPNQREIERHNVYNGIFKNRIDIKKRILFLDGAMGTMIQGYKLDEKDYRGERFAHWEVNLKTCRMGRGDSRNPSLLPFHFLW